MHNMHIKIIFKVQLKLTVSLFSFCVRFELNFSSDSTVLS